MTRWLVTGADGMLGRDVLLALGGERVTAATRGDLDITDAAAVLDAVAGHDLVVNTAAWTDVDGAETAEEAATLVNGTGAAHLAVACARYGARMIQISSDYVLCGNSASPYREDAPTTPVNAYGRSKLAGELAVREILPGAGYIVRTAWLYGAGGPNFVATVLRLATERENVDVVDDQRGQPTWSRVLAEQVRDLGLAARVRTAAPGVYHGTAAGSTSWYGLARAVFSETGLDPKRIRPTTSDRFVRAAARPSYSVLGQAAWAQTPVRPLGPWREALGEALRGGHLGAPRPA